MVPYGAISWVVVIAFAATAQAGAIDWTALCKRGTATAVTELTVGGGDEESEDEPPFLRPYDIAPAADGSFYVLDGDGYVVHFNPDGSEKNRFAREGEGPGELRTPFGIEVDAQGRVVVYDSGNHRFSFFRADGTLIATKPCQDFVPWFECTPDGRIVLEDEPSEMPRPGAKQLHRLVAFDADLNHPVVIDSVRAMKYQMVARDGQMTVATTPFWTELVFCTLADGSIAYGSNDRYALQVVGPDLKARFALERDVPAPAITGKDREEYYRGFEDNGEAFVAMLKRDVVWPKHKPYFEDLFAVGDVVVVVRGYEKAKALLDVFRGGRLVGTVDVAGFRRPRGIAGAGFFASARGQDQLPSVVKFHIE